MTKGTEATCARCLYRQHAPATRALVSFQRFFERAIGQDASPGTMTIDRRGANLAVLYAINVERETPIKVGQNKYLNTIFEQD